MARPESSYPIHELEPQKEPRIVLAYELSIDIILAYLDKFDPVQSAAAEIIPSATREFHVRNDTYRKDHKFEELFTDRDAQSDMLSHLDPEEVSRIKLEAQLHHKTKSERDAFLISYMIKKTGQK